MLVVLRRRGFLLLWTGGLVSVAGDWVLNAALPYFVYQVTGSTVATAAMIVAELAPSVLLSSVAGVFVDRWDRRRVLLVANVLQAASVPLLLLVADATWLWLVFAVAALQSTVAAFAGPAEAALLPTLVPGGDLMAANALNVFNDRLGRLAGLPLGGFLLGALGLDAVVLVDSATFLAAFVLILFVATPQRETSSVDAAAGASSAWARFWRDWLSGLRIVRDERQIALLFAVFGVATFGGTMLDPLTVAWARDHLHVGPEIYSLLSAAHAAAGIAGTLLVGTLRARLAPRDLIGWGSLLAGAFLIVKYDVPLVPLALLLSALGGATSVASAVGVETLAMQTVREDYRGRVFGSLNATLALLSLSGAALGGVLGEALGTVPMLNVASLLVAFTGILALVAFRPRALPQRA